MGYITPVPKHPHPLDVAAALKLVDMSLTNARKKAAYWASRVSELESAQAEWEAKK